MNFSGRGLARPGKAWRGMAWHGNTFPSTATGTIFQGKARRGTAWRGWVWPGAARQNACRWAVSPDTFVSNNQGKI